jgi:hypothetical protein
MTTKAVGAQQRTVEEIFCQNDAVSLCMLVNRRTRTMRVIDFRAGFTSAKRALVLSVAQREGVQKILTLVERDEVATWVKLGFAKEGSIPGFYKRSDAFLLGCGATDAAVAGDEAPTESETRLVAATPAGLAGSAPTSAGHETMERTIARARRALKDAHERPPMAARVALVDEAEARKAAAGALRSGRAITAFDPFGRDVARRFFLVSARGGFELYASIESQVCFGNAYLELLRSPRTEAEKTATTGALNALCRTLLAEEVISCFSLAPSDDVALAAVFLQNGFRRTGLLVDHLELGGERKDAIVWSRKLANPSDE